MRSYETQYERVQKETEKKEVLTSRREKLQRLLETERDIHTEELTARVSPVLQSLSLMQFIFRGFSIVIVAVCTMQAQQSECSGEPRLACVG
jgi:hypothetical protein